MASGQHAHRLLLLAALFVSLICASPVYAQASSDTETAAMKVLRLVKDANDEFDRGEFGDALRLYQDAYALYPEPVLLYRIGLSADKLGSKRRAVDAYLAFVDAAKSDDVKALEVTERIAELRATIPPLVTVTTTPAGADVTLNDVNGVVLGQTPNSFELPSNETTLVIRLTGYRVEKRPVTIANGDELSVDVELQKLSQLVQSDPPAEDDGGAGERGGGLGLGGWGWVTTGVGVALLGTGATFAILTSTATSKVNDYDKRAADASRNELEDLKDRANSRHSTSIAAFVAGGVVTAVGVSLVLVDVLTSDDEGSAVAPTLGFGQHGAWVGVGGRF